MSSSLLQLPRHRGPYQVMDRANSIYTIEDLVSGKHITTHIHNLRPFNYDPDRTSPLTVAQHNEQELIISYRGNRNKRSTMEFKARWAGFGESCDTWEPYKALLHVDKLHYYLRTNAMKTLIPRHTSSSDATPSPRQHPRPAPSTAQTTSLASASHPATHLTRIASTIVGTEVKEVTHYPPTPCCTSHMR